MADDPIQDAGRWVVIALGSNLGDSIRVVREAMDSLQARWVRGETAEGGQDCPRSGPIRRSSLWRTSPVGCPPGSTPFINAVVAMQPPVGETPESMLHQLQALEKQFGRKRKVIPNEARLLDLDLIAFGDLVRATPSLTLPHPRAHLRRFVLAPLDEIAPELVLPGQQQSVRQLLADLDSDEAIERIVEDGR